MKRQKAAKIQGLYAITSTELTADEKLLQAVEAVIQGGAKVIQYRNKRASDTQQYQQAGELALLCQQYHVCFLVNDDAQLAKSVAADGVHVGRDDGKITDARALLGEQSIIGVSCYNRLENAHKAVAEGADYVAFGRFFASQTKPQALQADLSLLDEAAQQLSVPIVAIGGIKQDNAQQLIQHGADALAVIHDLFHDEQQIYHTARIYQRFFQEI